MSSEHIQPRPHTDPSRVESQNIDGRGTSLFLGSGVLSAPGSGVVLGGEAEGDPQSFTEGSTHPGDKLGPTVKDDVLWNLTQMEHLLEHTLRQFHGVR